MCSPFKNSVVLAALALTAGCGQLDSEAIKACEDNLKSELRSPSTYNRISARETLMKNIDPAQIWVSLEYDAANAFGTPIRNDKICKYLVDESGQPDIDSSYDLLRQDERDAENEVDRFEDHLDNVL